MRVRRGHRPGDARAGGHPPRQPRRARRPGPVVGGPEPRHGPTSEAVRPALGGAAGRGLLAGRAPRPPPGREVTDRAPWTAGDAGGLFQPTILSTSRKPEEPN